MSDGDYYPLGSRVHLHCRVRDRDREPVDPTALSLRIKAPDGTETIRGLVELERESKGRYSYEFVPSTDGIWRFRFESDDPQAADEHAFHVSVSQFD